MDFEQWKSQVETLAGALNFPVPTELEMHAAFSSGVRVSEFTRLEVGKNFEQKVKDGTETVI